MIWTKDQLPETVYHLCFRGGLLVGSQAEACYRGLEPLSNNDWDILVPFGAWAKACMHIPKTARPNGFRGWRFPLFTESTIEVDVWPGSVEEYLRQASKDRLDGLKAATEFAHIVSLKDRWTSRVVLRA